MLLAAALIDVEHHADGRPPLRFALVDSHDLAVRAEDVARLHVGVGKLNVGITGG